MFNIENISSTNIDGHCCHRNTYNAIKNLREKSALFKKNTCQYTMDLYFLKFTQRDTFAPGVRQSRLMPQHFILSRSDKSKLRRSLSSIFLTFYMSLTTFFYLEPHFMQFKVTFVKPMLTVINVSHFVCAPSTSKSMSN